MPACWEDIAIKLWNKRWQGKQQKITTTNRVWPRNKGPQSFRGHWQNSNSHMKDWILSLATNTVSCFPYGDGLALLVWREFSSKHLSVNNHSWSGGYFSAELRFMKNAASSAPAPIAPRVLGGRPAPFSGCRPSALCTVSFSFLRILKRRVVGDRALIE